MFRELIVINVLLVFLTSVCGMEKKIQNRTNIYLNKCCSAGEYIGRRKSCGIPNITLNLYSKIKVFDEDISVTGKLFEDVFTLLPNKFNNKTFRKDALDVIELGHNVFLTESGVIQVELPNAYAHWTPVPIDRYCIDVDSRMPTRPRFWAILPIEEPYNSSNIYLTFVTLVSCFFMVLVLVVYLLLPHLRNLAGLIQMAYIFSLLMAFLLLIIVQIGSIPTEACIGLASGIYFFFLAAFCWMSVMSYDLWWIFRTRLLARQHKRGGWFKFMMYCLYAWGVPLLMTIGLVVINSYQDDMKHLPWFVTPRIPENGCFLQGGVKLLYLYIPMLILIISNWMFYLMTAFYIWRMSQGTAALTVSGKPQNELWSNRQKQRFGVYLKLSAVMGLSWLLEIVSFLSPAGKRMWFITDIYNSLIGLVLFLIFVCKIDIWNKLCKRFSKKKTKRWTSKSTCSSKVDSSRESMALAAQISFQPNGLKE